MNDTRRLELSKVVVAAVLYLSYRGMGGAGWGGIGECGCTIVHSQVAICDRKLIVL